MGIKPLGLAFAFLFLAAPLFPQALNYGVSSEQTHAILNAGVSYDLLRYPTNVSFDYPEGYLSFNIPLDLTTNKYDLGGSLDSSNEKFTPRIGARQRLNFAFRVNVPVLNGVLTYAQTENVNFDFSMNLGTSMNQEQTIIPDSSVMTDVAKLYLAGAVNLPIRFQMGWRTQTFGYAFKPVKDVTVALNLHKHLFELTANGGVNTNILGNVFIDMPSKNMPSRNLMIDYSEEDVFGQISGNFKGSAWSPALGVKWWRLTWTTRMGVRTKVDGHFTMKWHLPFFMNPEPKSFGLQEDELVVTKMDQYEDSAGNLDLPALVTDFNNLETNLNASATDSFVLHTETPMEFNIPTGHTLMFEAWKKHLFLSYTLIHGGAISGYHENEAGQTDLDLGFNVNHVVVMNLVFKHARMTTGAFLFDFYETGKKNWLSKSTGFGDLGGVPVPILNFATTIGSTARILLEVDLLPIPALKSGLVYYF